VRRPEGAAQVGIPLQDRVAEFERCHLTEQQSECRTPQQKAWGAAQVFDRLTVLQVARRRFARGSPRRINPSAPARPLR
jgi:hypothetical protein